MSSKRTVAKQASTKSQASPAVLSFASKSGQSPANSPCEETREQRIEEIMNQLRPKIEQTVRELVERAVDVPEAQEFGAIDFEFRDAGLDMANEVRQASMASRKKRGT